MGGRRQKYGEEGHAYETIANRLQYIVERPLTVVRFFTSKVVGVVKIDHKRDVSCILSRK